MPDEKIAELISGEAEMLREAHVMGLARVLSTHMHRADDDSSVDFQKIKPVIESLKNSEVLKALNEEVLRVREEKKKEEKKWTTFLQKPKRPPPRPKYGYYRYVEEEDVVEEPYKVKIVKQPKPKVAPDYKPEDFDTGPLPWEQPQPEIVPGAPPIEPEEPILIPEEGPEFLEAVDPTPESEVPDLEDTGIPLPPPRPPSPLPIIELQEEHIEEAPQQQFEPAPIEEETEEDMDGEQLAEQLLKNVQKMVDPNATLEQQLAQMRAQIAALAQLPGVIQQTLDLVARQISQLSYKESAKTQAQEEQQYQVTEETYESEVENQEAEERQEQIQEQRQEYEQPTVEITEPEEDQVRTEERQEEHVQEESKTMLSEEELARRKKQEEEMLAEQQKIEKQRKEVMQQMKLEHESRQVKQRPTPRVSKPKPMFGPPVPVNRPLVLPGGRKWRRPQDVYDEQMIAEMINAHSEVIQGKAMGINFMKYEKPPVSLDHLQRSEVYKVVHNLDETPLKRVETLTPVIAESDYRERVRSLSPFPSEQRVTIPPQLQP
ncbi:uncharacterized protein Zasp67 isoform X1 [Epargyreus clarus]|uniref:uncharacterized protein Zasp67 isoform X1 n=1 Tax=Epargyreus clarus TaxID=520877 RepID=UPI003C2EED68